jgi:hypothetical protein
MTDSMNGADPGLAELVPAYRENWAITGNMADGYTAWPRPRGRNDMPVTASTADRMRELLGPSDDERAEDGPPRVTVRLYLQGDDAARMLAAGISDPALWQLADLATGDVYTPYAVERVAGDVSGPAEAGASLAAVHADAERWTQVTGRPAGP